MYRTLLMITALTLGGCPAGGQLPADAAEDAVQFGYDQGEVLNAGKELSVSTLYTILFYASQANTWELSGTLDVRPSFFNNIPDNVTENDIIRYAQEPAGELILSLEGQRLAALSTIEVLPELTSPSPTLLRFAVDADFAADQTLDGELIADFRDDPQGVIRLSGDIVYEDRALRFDDVAYRITEEFDNSGGGYGYSSDTTVTGRIEDQNSDLSADVDERWVFALQTNDGDSAQSFKRTVQSRVQDDATGEGLAFDGVVFTTNYLFEDGVFFASDPAFWEQTGGDIVSNGERIGEVGIQEDVIGGDPSVNFIEYTYTPLDGASITLQTIEPRTGDRF